MGNATATATRTAIVILSDPNSGSEEALGRLFNGLAAAHEFKQRGDDVQIIFQGTGTRWLGHITRPDHPAHALFNDVRDVVAGASSGCATVFGAADDVRRAGFELIHDYALPGTSGMPSLRSLVGDGYTVLTF
jgi:hypothetical protein